MKQITFRELLNLMYENKPPKWVKFERNGIIYRYIDTDYFDCDGEQLSNDIRDYLSLKEMACEECIIYDDRILTYKEKDYLSELIKPFKKYVLVIIKIPVENQERIIISYHDYLNAEGLTSCILLPTFKQGTMYKGMELYKEYTLEELGL